LGFALWAHAWADGAGTHTLCGCGDPALFLWFFQSPATSLAHLQNPFYSTAMFHPTGINLLDQTSVLALSVPLIPVTWLFGPVASFNVACTIVPALTALTMFVVLRRWVHWLPAAYIGGLLFGFSPFVLASLEYGHLMTAALMLLPLILAVLDEILVRQRHSARRAGVALGLLVFAQFFLSAELLVVVIMVSVFSVAVLVVTAYVVDRERLRVRAPHAGAALGVGVVVAAVLLAYPILFALTGPAHLSGVFWPDIDRLDGATRSLLVNPVPDRTLSVIAAYGGYAGSPLPSGSYLGWGLIGVLIGGTALWFRDRRLWFYGLLLAVCVVCSFDQRSGPWVPARFFAHVPLVDNILPQRFLAVGFLAAAVMLALIVDRVRARAGGGCGGPGPPGRQLPPGPAVHHGGRGPAPVVRHGGPASAPGPGAALVPGGILGDPGGTGMAGGEPHGLQPGRRGRPRGDERPRRTGGTGIRRAERAVPRVLLDRAEADGGQPRLGERRLAHLEGEYRGDRPGAVGPGRPAGARPRLCRRVHDGGAGAAPGHSGRGLGLGRRPHRSPLGDRGRRGHRLGSAGLRAPP